jgi:nanoRNase/pAp phosphatase (c-di-AMP/oligoRNAs hydrolase)
MSTIITTHKNIDFDALASVVAAHLLYPEALPVLPHSINPNVKAFLSFHKDEFQWLDEKATVPADMDKLIVVDTCDWQRLDKQFKANGTPVMLWDHHAGPGTIEADWRCHETMGANITLMTRSLRAEGLELSRIQATLFLIGLYEDTGNLTFPSTTAEDAAAAAYLLRHNADLTLLGRFLRPAYGQKQKEVLFRMLQGARRTKINGHSVSISRLAIEGHVGNLALVVRMYRDIMNVDAAFGVFTDNGGKRCILIGRSDVEELNIGDIMRSLGGGGHPGAGSAMLKGVNPDVAVQMLNELIEGNQQASVQISDLMSFPVLTVKPDTTMRAVADLLKTKGCTGLPVVQDDETLVGIISRRDFRKIRKESQLSAPVKAFMSRKVTTVAPGKSPLQAARIMIRHDIGRLPVVQDGKLIGIVTRSDAMCYFYDMLPS